MGDFITNISSLQQAILIIVIITGAIFFVLFMLRKLRKESNPMKIENTVGKTGEVYLSVGASRSRLGKISIEMGGENTELSALTDEKEELKKGEKIIVLEVINDEILLIERVN